MRGAEQLGAGDEELDETFLNLQVHARRLAAHELLANLPVSGSAQLRASFAQYENDVTAHARVARDGAIRPREQPDHPHDWCGVDGPGGTLIVEGNSATGH